MRRFPQPEFSAFLNLFNITLQITFRASFGCSITNIIYYCSTVLGTIQTYIELVGTLLWHFLSHIPATMLETRGRFHRSNLLTVYFSYSFPQIDSVLHLLQPIYTWLKRKGSVKCHPLCTDGNDCIGEGAEGSRLEGGRYHPCIVNLKSCTLRCADVEVLVKASGGTTIQTAGLKLCLCNYDLSNFTSVVLVLWVS